MKNSKYFCKIKVYFIKKKSNYKLFIIIIKNIINISIINNKNYKVLFLFYLFIKNQLKIKKSIFN